uniref:Uncharacterized protein n=1 Tax=viral metagenome TaxID=1070528 RepID=A0A6H1ZWB8_9ZZZZ
MDKNILEKAIKYLDDLYQQRLCEVEIYAKQTYNEAQYLKMARNALVQLATKQINDVIEEYYSEVNKLSDNELWKFCRSEKVGDIIRKLGKIPTPATDKCLACQNGKIVVEVISGECDIKDCPQCLGTGLAAPSKDICGICGGKQVKIRGRYPKTSDRLVCPTCCQERLERINHISDKNYGIACQEVK